MTKKPTPGFRKAGNEPGYNKNILSGIDAGYMNLYLAIWEKALSDERLEALKQLGYINNRRQRIKKGELSEEVTMQIKLNILEDTYFFPDYLIYDKDEIWRYPRRKWEHDYSKFKEEDE